MVETAKTGRRRFLTAAAGFALTFAFQTAATAETRWQLAVSWPDTNFHTRNLRQFAGDVQEATKGALRIVVHSNNSLFNLQEILNATRTGQVQVGEVLMSAYGNEMPLLEINTIPFIVEGKDAAWELYQKQRPFLEKALEERGLKLLFVVAWPGQGMYTKKPIASASEFKGMKFRAYSAVLARWGELLKMESVVVSMAELPQAFGSGMVDTMMTSSPVGLNTQAWDYAKYYYAADASHGTNMTFVNKAAFDALTPDVKTALLTASERAEKRGWEMADIQDKEALETMRKRGMTVAKFNEATAAELRRAGAETTRGWLRKANKDIAAAFASYAK